MKTQAEQWLKSDRARQLIKNKSVTWFNSKIQPDLAQETDPICRKFQIPRSSLRFEEGIDPDVVNPELSIGDAILADTVAFIVNVVIGGGTIGSIIALILTGHLTWPIVLIYGVSVLAAGVELTRSKVQQAIKENVDIPSWTRSSFLNDSKIDDISQRIKPELEEVLRKQLTENRQAFDELIAKVGQELKKALNTKAEEAVILIQ
jgi:molecular chaperone DnaK (HSP70)